MPAVVFLTWIGFDGLGVFAAMRYTGLVVVGTVLGLVAIPAFRLGGARLRGVSLGVMVGGGITALLASVLSLG